MFSFIDACDLGKVHKKKKNKDDGEKENQESFEAHHRLSMAMLLLLEVAHLLCNRIQTSCVWRSLLLQRVESFPQRFS